LHIVNYFRPQSYVKKTVFASKNRFFFFENQQVRKEVVRQMEKMYAFLKREKYANVQETNKYEIFQFVRFVKNKCFLTKRN